MLYWNNEYSGKYHSRNRGRSTERKRCVCRQRNVLFSEEKNFFSKKRKHPQFRFFLVHIGGRIRFFFEVPTKYREFFESQLYAHYNNIEITESSLPFAENQEFFTQE